MAEAGDGGGSPYRVRYGHDIFCTGHRVDPGGGNEGEVADLFSRCLHAKIKQSKLLEPRKTKADYEAAVDKAAREMFRAICLEDRRKFVQASTNQPMRDGEAIEILTVELMELRNTLKIRMKHAAAAAAEIDQRRQQEEQARRDEERARRDREEFEREQRKREYRRHPLPNGTSAGGNGGRDRWCANPVSPSPAYAYAFDGDHPAWGGMGMGQRRQGSDRRSPFHRSDDHDVFASASACDSDGGERGAGKAPAASPPKPDKLTQVRQRMAEMQRKRKGKESEERTRGDDRAPNRGGGGNGGRGSGRGAPSSSFHGHIPRKRASASDEQSKGNKSGQKQSNKKQNIGEKHRFRKLVSATEASSPPPKRKPTWEPPPGRTHAPANLAPPTSPGRDTAKGEAMTCGKNQGVGRKVIGKMPQQVCPTSPVAPAKMPEDSKNADAAVEDEMTGGFDADDAESLPSVSATLGESESQSANNASPRVDLEFSSDASPFSKKRGLKVSRKKAASEAPSSMAVVSKSSVDEVVGADGNSALPSKVNKNQDALKAKKILTKESAEEAAVTPVDVPLPSIVGLDGIVTIEPMGQDAYEKLQNPVMKGRSLLVRTEKLPPWPARVAADAESRKCLKEYWEAGCNVSRSSYVCVYVFYPPPRHFDSSSDSPRDASTSPSSPPRGPECGVEFVHFSRIRPLFEDKRSVTAESSWSECYHRAFNVAAALRQWALGSNMTVTLEDKITHFPHEQVGDYGVVFSIKKEEWDSASHIGAQTVLKLILSNALVQKHTTYSNDKYTTARTARYQQLGCPSGTTRKADGSQSHGVAPPASTEASFSNVLNLLGDDDDEDEASHEDDLFSDGDANRRRDLVFSSKRKGTREPPRMTSRAVYDPTEDTTMDLDDIVGSDGIVMVTGNDAKRSIHHPWPARIASAEESDEHRLKELKIGRDVDPYEICVFYFLPCWGDTTELAGGVERWYFCDFVDSSRIHGFGDPDIDLNTRVLIKLGMSDDIVLRYKRAWTIAAGLRYWSSGLEAEAPRKPHKCKVNGCPRIHEKIRDYGPVLKIKDNEWVDGSNTLNPDSIVKVINKFLVSKGICRFSYSDEKSKAARGDLGANYSSWLRGRSTNDGDTLSPAHTSRKSTRLESSRPSRSHDLFIAYDDCRGGAMTNGGAKIVVKSEDNGMDETREGGNTRGTKMELVKIQNVGEFCVKEDEVGSKTMKIFRDFAAVDKNKSTEENRLAKLVEDACNRLVVLEGKLSAHGINPDD